MKFIEQTLSRKVDYIEPPVNTPRPVPGQKVPEEQRRTDLLRAAYRVAARERLGGLTTRAVAVEAGVSNGLVFFHFGSREGLLLALLDRLLATTVVAPSAPADPGGVSAERLLETIARDVQALPAQRERVALLVDFWVMGTTHPEVQAQIRGALAAYRDAYLPLAAAAVASEPERYRGVTADGLAGVATGFVEGCALQVVMDPQGFDVAACLGTLRALVLHPAETV